MARRMFPRISGTVRPDGERCADSVAGSAARLGHQDVGVLDYRAFVPNPMRLTVAYALAKHIDIAKPRSSDPSDFLCHIALPAFANVEQAGATRP